MATDWDARERDASDRVAVVRVVPRDDVRPLGLAKLDKVLPGELDGRLVGLGPGREEDGVRESARLVPDKHLPKRLGSLQSGRTGSARASERAK